MRTFDLDGNELESRGSNELRLFSLDGEEIDTAGGPVAPVAKVAGKSKKKKKPAEPVYLGEWRQEVESLAKQHESTRQVIKATEDIAKRAKPFQGGLAMGAQTETPAIVTPMQRGYKRVQRGTKKEIIAPTGLPVTEGTYAKDAYSRHPEVASMRASTPAEAAQLEEVARLSQPGFRTALDRGMLQSGQTLKNFGAGMLGLVDDLGKAIHPTNFVGEPTEENLVHSLARKLTESSQEDAATLAAIDKNYGSPAEKIVEISRGLPGMIGSVYLSTQMTGNPALGFAVQKMADARGRGITDPGELATQGILGLAEGALFNKMNQMQMGPGRILAQGAAGAAQVPLEYRIGASAEQLEKKSLPDFGEVVEGALTNVGLDIVMPGGKADSKVRATEALQSLPEPDRNAVQFALVSPDPNSFKGLTPKQREAALLNWQMEADSRLKTPDGQPIPLYHGTQSPKVIEEIDLSKADPDALYGPGFYMTQDPEVAAGEGGYAFHKAYSLPRTERIAKAQSQPDFMERFNKALDLATKWGEWDDTPELRRQLSADIFEQYVEEGKLVENVPHAYKLYANIRKPFDVDVPPDPALLREFGKEFDSNYVIEDGNDFYSALTDAFDGDKEMANSWLKAKGFDGITHTGGGLRGTNSKYYASEEEAKIEAQKVGGKVERLDSLDIRPHYEESSDQYSLRRPDGSAIKRDSGIFSGSLDTYSTYDEAVKASKIWKAKPQYRVEGHRVWIAFEPTQVKSAWAKEFDPGSTKIEAAELDSGSRPQETKSPSFKFTQPAARFYEGRDQRGGTVYVNPQMAAKLGDWPATAGAVNVETKEFGRMLARLDKNDPQAKVLEAAFVEAIKKDQPSVNIVIYSEGTGMWARRLTRHEGFHRGQYLASREALKAEGKEGLFQPDIGTIHDPALHDHPVVQRVANSPIGESIKSHYADSYVPAAMTFETAAYMASNDFRRFGVSADEAALFVKDYLKSVANKSGVKGLQALVDGTRLIPSIEQAAKEIISGRTEQTIGTGRGGADIPGRLGGTVGEFAESGTVGSGDRGDGGTGVQAEAGASTNELAPGPGKPFWGRPRRGLGKTALLSNAPDMRYVPDAQGKGGALYANPKAMATYFNLDMSHPNHVDMRGVALNVDGIGIMAGLAEKSGKALAPILRAFHTDLVNKGAEKGFVAIHRPGSKVERDVLYHEDAHIAQSKFKTEEWREVWNRMKGDEGWEKALNSPYGKAIKEYGTTRGWNEENPSSEQIEQVVKELEAYLIMGGPGQANIRKGLGMSEEEVGNMLTRLHATLKEVAGTERVEEAYSGIHLRPGTRVFMYPSFSTPEPPNIYTTVLSSDAVKEIANKAGQVLKVLGIPENPLLRPHEQIMQALKDYPDKATPEAIGAAMRQLGLDGKDLVEAVDEASRHAGQLLRNLQDANAKWDRAIKEDPKWAIEMAKTGAHVFGLGPSPKETLKKGLAELEASELGRTWSQRGGDLYRKQILSLFKIAAINFVSTIPRLPLDLVDGMLTGAVRAYLDPQKYVGKSQATIAEAAREGAIAGAQATMEVAMAFPDMAKRLLRQASTQVARVSPGLAKKFPEVNTPTIDRHDFIISQMMNLHPELHTKLTGLSTGIEILAESKAKIEDLKSLLPYLNDSEKHKEYEARLDILQKRYDANHSALGRAFNRTGWVYDQFLKPNQWQEFFLRRPYFVGRLATRATDAGYDLYELVANTKKIEDFSKDPSSYDVNEILSLKTLADLPPDVWEGAADDALTFTYAYNPKENNGRIEKLAHDYIEFNKSMGLIGAVFDAFPKPLYNGLKFAYEYTPLAMIKPGMNIRKDYKEGGPTAIKMDDISRMVKGSLGVAMFATALYIRKEYGGEEWYQIKTGKKDKKGQPIYFSARKLLPFAGMLYVADVALRASEGRLGETKSHLDTASELYLNARRTDNAGAVFFDSLKELTEMMDSGTPMSEKTKRAALRPVGNILGVPLTPLVNLRDMVAQFDEDEAARRDQKGAPILGPAIDKIPWLRSSEKYGLPLTQPPTEQAPRPFSAAPGLTWFGVNLDPGSNFATREFARLGLSPIRWLKPDPDPVINRAQYAAYSKKLAAIAPKIEASPLYQKKTDAQKAAFWEAKLAGPDGIAAEARELGQQANPKEINKREILQSQPPLMRKATGLDKKVNEVKNASDNK